jgi:hypothetical protein
MTPDGRQRGIGAAVALITVIVVLIMLALFERLPAKVALDCFDATERERVRELAMTAIDKGFLEAVAHLYSIWQKDPDSDQPKRAQVGMHNALNAHARARKFAVVWDPPRCETPTPAPRP